MSGTSYSRTDGIAILPGTYAFVRTRRDIHDADKLPANQRYSYDTCTNDEREAFDLIASAAKFEPPSYIKFDLAKGSDPIFNYPGATDPSQGFIAGGEFHEGDSRRDMAHRLGISEEALAHELSKFSGKVTLVLLPKGRVIYRTIGLTASKHSLGLHGSITNKILHTYWEPTSPNKYVDEAHWRAKTAVKAEWNGDYAQVRLTLKQDVLVLSGRVGMQKIDRNGDAVLPGGAVQYFIPNLTSSYIVENLDAPLKTLLVETTFGSEI
jgi:hypothetical protein